MNGILSQLAALDPLPGEVIADHSGPVTAVHIAEWGARIRNGMHLSMNQRILLFGVFVELIQNVARHSAIRDGQSPRSGGVGRVSIVRRDDAYEIRTANPIHPTKQTQIESLICKLTLLGRADLDQLFRQQIQIRSNGTVGAGLGLIEIARRCHGRLCCKLEQTTAEHPILILTATIPIRDITI